MSENILGNFGTPRLLEIERWRAKWRSDDSPLVDGSLPEAGPFDGNDTVATCCSYSRGKRGAELIYLLALTFGAKRALELGTNLGISTAYIGTAQLARNQKAEIHTVDASPYRLQLAKQMHEELKLKSIFYHSGRFYDVLPGLMETVGVIDFVFVDGQHDQKATREFFEIIYPQLAPTALYLQNGIELSDGMRGAWSRISQDERVNFSTEINGLGVMVVQRG